MLTTLPFPLFVCHFSKEILGHVEAQFGGKGRGVAWFEELQIYRSNIFFKVPFERNSDISDIRIEKTVPSTSNL